ncbi:MAG TPA: hypothetical protein EYP71_02670 [Dehalococcoidia bacterium]|nr:hypothetical protein [Dehalococcoidia bacterium]
MDRKRIILIKTNLIDFDPRLIKDVKALKHGGMRSPYCAGIGIARPLDLNREKRREVIDKYE